jgi:hypothetical protein
MDRPCTGSGGDGYQIELKHDMFTTDAEINKALHDKGFTNEQAQYVYDLAGQKLIPMILEMACEFEAERRMDRLVAAFGTREKFAEISRQLLAYGKKNLPQDVLDGLSSTYEGVMALSWAAQMLSIAFVILDAPEKAGTVMAAMSNLDTVWTVGLSVLGIYVYKRSQEKQAGK